MAREVGGGGEIRVRDDEEGERGSMGQIGSYRGSGEEGIEVGELREGGEEGGDVDRPNGDCANGGE